MTTAVSNTSGHRNGGAPTAGQRLVASFDTYAAAQALVDRMSDNGFPVEHVRIVGNGLRTVEQITGRMTKGKAAWLAWPAVRGSAHLSAYCFCFSLSARSGCGYGCS